jgi:hypothetical protein
MTSIRIVHNPPRRDPDSKQSERPLTHHEILALIGPFTRRGRHLDMSATQRAQRQLVFKPTEQPSPLVGLPVLREVLQLEVSERGSYRLVRTLTAADPTDPRLRLSATLTAAGPDPELLLTQIEGFSPARHFPAHGGVPVQRSYRLTGATGHWAPVLTDARAEVEGVTLLLDGDRGGGLPAHLHLSAPPGHRLAVPEDLLAVIGRHWRPLEDYNRDWRGTIRVAKREPERTPDLEDKLARTVVHLAQTLSEPPGAFHTRHRRARWQVSLRRATPLLTALGLIAATPAVSLLPMGEGTLLRMLVFHAPPLMLAAFFMFSELPRIEIPPLPRSLNEESWIAEKR